MSSIPVKRLFLELWLVSRDQINSVSEICYLRVVAKNYLTSYLYHVVSKRNLG